MRVCFLLIMLAWSGLSLGGVEIHTFDNRQQEQQYKRLIDELRCLVCQNQNLADSNAELAQDLRQEVYEMIQKGESDEQIIEFMVARYGDFVLYRPPFKTTTLFLWVGPFVILLAGLVIVVMIVRNRRRTAIPEMDIADQQRARQLLEDEDENEKSGDKSA